MRINNRTCTKCVNDRTIKGISFNKDGVCSFCEAYDSIKDRLHDYDNLEKLFIKKIKNSGHKYDAAVGFSGGKDSTYVLYKLVKQYKLKVKAFTLDNGFMSDDAKRQIDKIVKELGVDHEYVIYDNTILKEMYKYIVSKYLSPCIACAFLGYAAMINYPSRIDAAVMIHGRSIPQMMRNYQFGGKDYFKPFIEDGLSEESKDPRELFESVIQGISKLVDAKLADLIKNEMLKDAYLNGFRPFVGYFLYHQYDLNEIMDVLNKSTSWEQISKEEHYDCLIHHGALYLKNLIARRSHLMPEISVEIREGTISREEGLKKISIKDNKLLAKKELKLLCNYANISYTKLMLKAKIYSKRWW